MEGLVTQEEMQKFLDNLCDLNPEDLPSLEDHVTKQLAELMEADAAIPPLGFGLWKLVSLSWEYEEYMSQVVQLSGSFVEGAMMARCFQKKREWKEAEMDIMHNLVNLPQSVSDVIEDVDGKPGFVRLPYADLYAQYFAPAIPEKFHEHKEYVPFTEAPFISPAVFKRNVRHFMRYQVSDLSLTNAVLSLFFGPCELSGCDMSTETTTEISADVRAKDGGELLLHVSIDHVPAVRLLFWPQQAAAWIDRPSRCFPAPDTIQSIVDNGCQLVPRSSPGGDMDAEWRLSFSKPEEALARLRSAEQQRAYYFFKMLFYRYLKGVGSSEASNRTLFSYIAKTTMLWACEEYPPEEPVWQTLESSSHMLLSRLADSLQSGRVRHYFMPEINLLDRIGEDVREKCIEVIANLQANVFIATPFDMPEKLEFITGLLGTLRKATSILSVLAAIGAHLKFDALLELLTKFK